jgi:hypothetical protein
VAALKPLSRRSLLVGLVVIVVLVALAAVAVARHQSDDVAIKDTRPVAPTPNTTATTPPTSKINADKKAPVTTGPDGTGPAGTAGGGNGGPAFSSVAASGPTGQPPAVGQQFPTPGNTGTPAGWKPKSVHQGDLVVDKPNTVIEDIEVTGEIDVQAANVTIRRARVHGRVWNQFYPKVQGSALTQFHMTVQDSDIGDGTTLDNTDDGAIGPGNYVAENNEVRGSDGFRVSQADAVAGGDGSIVIRNNWFEADDVNGDCEHHVDGVQGYFGGNKVTITGNTLDSRMQECVTGMIFFGDDSKGATVEGNLLMASSYPLRIQDDHTPDVGPWSIHNNALVYNDGPGALTPGTECGAASMSWSGNHKVAISPTFAITQVLDEVRCGDG